MKPLRISPCHTHSTDRGWVIAMVLMILAVTLGLTLASASMVLFHLKSSHAYYRIVQDAFVSTEGGKTLSRNISRLSAPEGWDHIHFFTELVDQGVEDVRSFSWRVTLRDQPREIPGGYPVPSLRPHVVVIIDDSLAMNASSGQDYREESLYLWHNAGGVVHASECCEIADTHPSADGTYFSGRWGNANHRAPSANGLSGAMPSWTLAFSRARSLIESLDQCEVAVMSTSRGQILPFTHNGAEIMQALDGIHPTSPQAPLSESLYRASEIFPAQCISNRHILVVTAGIPVNDGHLPSWLKDYDRDNNPGDTAFEGEGSHCLDDVSAYVRSLGILVHVMGPDTGYLRVVAAKGGGRLMPLRDDIAPEGTTVTGPLAIHQGRPLSLTNPRACFHPPWVMSDTGIHARPSITDPLESVSCSDLSVTGIARSSACDASNMYCTTSRDQIVKIDLSRGDLSWLVQDIGGTVLLRGNHIIAGPNRHGVISCLTKDAHLLWHHPGTCMDASDSLVFVSAGSVIQPITIKDGILLSSYDTMHGITVIRYDPVSGSVLAGTADGLLYSLSQGLGLTGIISTGMNDAVIEIRPFTRRKVLHLLAMSRTRLMDCTASGPVWSVSLDAGEPQGVTVMDGKVFVALWNVEAPCRGMDTGMSTLLEYDALTGERIGSEPLFVGRAFGPAIDLDGAALKFISGSGEIRDRDISALTGMSPCPLGKKLLRQSE
ncbi:MAG: hypothetical protein MUD15_03685 [Desulfobacterota bacterium]|nr:hypothetical protein [Thermodesulfobacteriota bacterium]